MEILAPAGNFECAEAAIHSGADAIYLGLSTFSARQSAENFDEAALFSILERAHFCGVKVYVAMNTLVKDEELSSFCQNLVQVWNMGVDAVILQDVFLGRYIHECYPDIVLHLSTQAGVCNVEGAKLAKAYGFSRVILARETPLSEIEKIASILETEVFIQGALCSSFSGQCYFSSFVGGNSGNRGRCKQPCRKLYSFDRNENQDKTYALSLSDLSVGEDIEKLIKSGVFSFKIEGRMRRAEYVASSVAYYRALLDGRSAHEQLSDLKRTYNRGNYTKGLAFGQDKRFLSTAIQGHIGEKVGVVKVINGKFFVESKHHAKMGDAFKILRNGKEVGGASFLKTEGRGFILTSKIRLRNGDGVFITTDTEVNQRVLQAKKKGKLSLELIFEVGKPAEVRGGGVVYHSEVPLQAASNRPLTVEELQSCFSKTDGLPIEVIFSKIDVVGDIFIPKSQLNAIRRTYFDRLSRIMREGTESKYVYLPIERDSLIGECKKSAVISNDFTGEESVDIAILKMDDMRQRLPSGFVNGNFEKYLYYNAFLTEKDTSNFKKWVQEYQIDGIYAENYGGIIFAKENGLKVFAGTGFNLFNVLSIKMLLREACVSYYAISKELNALEVGKLVSQSSFVLTGGNIKLMDLCYCPFEKTCNVCDKKGIYTLTDENRRVFPVRRYTSADGTCRFEVYNCADLIGEPIKNVGRLSDLTLVEEKNEVVSAKDETTLKTIYERYTSGHFKRGVQ